MEILFITIIISLFKCYYVFFLFSFPLPLLPNVKCLQFLDICSDLSKLFKRLVYYKYDIIKTNPGLMWLQGNAAAIVSFYI